MHHTSAIRSLVLCLVLSLGGILPGVSLADDFEDAMSSLADGDRRIAFREFKRLARQDHPEAQYQLGMLYLFGQGVDMDVEQGIQWLKQAADNGVYLAANELGQIYVSGRGVEPDQQEAIKWVQRATELAEQNSGEADDGCE